jgi:hypothetical protein
MLTECRECGDPLFPDMDTCPGCGWPNPSAGGNFDPGSGTPAPERQFEIGMDALARKGPAAIALLVFFVFIVATATGLVGGPVGLERWAVGALFAVPVVALGALVLFLRRRRVQQARRSRLDASF